jgi:arginyl-tRNA--protein-N-Asp/Glu arginylyltransferase
MDFPGSESAPSRPDPGAARLLAWVDADRLPRTPLHACPYLPDLRARERAFVADELDPELYHDLMDRGFRRSGGMFYAMDCPGCRRCVPLRIPTAEFRPSRSQRRAQRKNRDVEVCVAAPALTPETFDLYRRYVAHQHAETEVPIEAVRGLYANVVGTVEVAYTIGATLVGKSLLDVCSRSVSAVYHFYDPAHRDRSLGVFSVLAEIEWARSIGIPYYYLGYWIEAAPTMRYKASFQPHELLEGRTWRRA